MKKEATLNTDSPAHTTFWDYKKLTLLFLSSLVALVLILVVVFFVFVQNKMYRLSVNKSSIKNEAGRAYIIPPVVPSEANPGGETTVSFKPFPSFMLPAKNMAESEKRFFHAGKALAHQPWVRAPTITDARDGLGPLYNARTCLSCHINGGRGNMPVDDKSLLISSFLRLSLPGTDNIHGVVPEPVYGDQLQSQSVSLAHQLRTRVSPDQLENKEVAPEAYVFIDWQTKQYTYPDHQTLTLRDSKPILKNIGYGKMHPDTLMGLRNAPPLLGVGLLELIAQKDLDKQADPDDRDNNGISGRVNQVWDFEAKKTVAGRFGLKANKASVRLQSAGAFANDMGISNPVFPQQNCTKSQTLCHQTANGNNKDDGVEISESLLTLVVNFTKSLAVPMRRKPNNAEVLKGRTLFLSDGLSAMSCAYLCYSTINRLSASFKANYLALYRLIIT